MFLCACVCVCVCGETCLSAPELGEVEPVGCGTPDKGDANTLTQDHREGEARQREGRRATQTPGLVLFSNLEEKKKKLFFFLPCVCQLYGFICELRGMFVSEQQQQRGTYAVRMMKCVG